MDNDSVVIGTREYPVWPTGQEVRPLGHRTIGITTFADAGEFDVLFEGRLRRALRRR